jgi:RHS repeat-associated protein
MSALARTIESDCYTRAANEDCINGGPRTRTKYVYDNLTRPSTKTITIPSDASYVYAMTYNTTTGLLDTLQYPSSTGTTPLKLQYVYTNGLQSQIKDFSAGTIYWTANTVNPSGQLTKETLGNGVVVTRSFDALTGWQNSIQAGVGGGSALQNNAYLFDEMGDLTQRQDNNQGLTENFFYDNLYRITSATLNGIADEATTYDATGNMLTWSINGGTSNTLNYTLPQTGCTYYANTQPHAVRSDTQGSNKYSFCYDANGNTLSQTGGSSYFWTSYNQPSELSAFGATSQFYYNQDHQRYMQRATGYPNSPETTMYIGGLMEKVITPAGTAYRHYIPAGANTVLYMRWSTGSNPTYYITKDHLGSNSIITNSSGALVLNESFSAWGLRRGSNWQGFESAADDTAIANTTRRGFTGQEELDNVSMVNMNGRIYQADVMPGRFLSADPHVTYPGNTQSWNRYSYVMNNPLTYTDPSGLDTAPDPYFPPNDNNSIGGLIPLNPYWCVSSPLCAAGLSAGNGNTSLGGLQTTSQSAVAAAAGSEELAEVIVTAQRMAIAGGELLADIGGGIVVTSSRAVGPAGAGVLLLGASVALVANNPLMVQLFGRPDKRSRRIVLPQPTTVGPGQDPNKNDDKDDDDKIDEITVIGRTKDLENLRPGEVRLDLPNRFNDKLNWRQNYVKLREAMARGRPIRDASPLDKSGRWLNAERWYLEDNGWSFDKDTSYWNPPRP